MARLSYRIVGVTLMLLSLYLRPSSSSAEVPELSASQTAEHLSKGALLVDVRSDDEWNSGHLKGAIHIPVTEIEARMAELGADRSREVVLYCRSGGRSGKAGQIVKEGGFVSVFNAGGFDDLRESLPEE